MNKMAFSSHPPHLMLLQTGKLIKKNQKIGYEKGLAELETCNRTFWSLQLEASLANVLFYYVH